MKKYILLYIIIVISAVSISFSAVSAFDFRQDSGLEATAVETGHTSTGINEGNLAWVVGDFIRIGLSFVGIIFFVLMIYGGFIWMTARGNEQQVEKAKSILVNSIIGLIIVMSAYAITAFVVDGNRPSDNPADTGVTFENCDPASGCSWVNGEAVFIDMGP